jgi:hypothetical protein
MAGLDPAIHVLGASGTKDVDARDKRGHDEGFNRAATLPIFQWRADANQRLNTMQRSPAMSRHHILPPIIYTPEPPKPKEARRKRGVGYARGAGLTDETEETEGVGETSRTTQPRAASALPPHSAPVENVERRVPSPNGKLSDDTLKAMLEVQEKDGEPSL